MKVITATSTLALLALCALSTAQACPGHEHDKITQNLKTHTGQAVTTTQSPALPDAKSDRPLLVDVDARPAEKSDAAN